MGRVVAVGEMLIDFTALETDTSVLNAGAFTRNPGGAPANVAVAVAKLGQQAAFAGCVGEDPFGSFLIQTLVTYGVQTEQVFQVPAANTSLAFVARQSGDPDYFFVRNPGADVLFGPDLARQVAISAETILHFGSNSLAEQPIREAIMQLVERVHQAGAIVSFDVNLRPAFWRGQDGEALTLCRQMVMEADIVKVNRDELRWLAGKADIDEGLQVLGAWAPGLLLCTLGSEGAVLSVPDGLDPAARQVHRVAGFPADCVDATGAGDACIGALIAQLLERGVTRQGWATIEPTDWVSMTSFACAAAAVNVTRTGAIHAMPVRAEVEALLNQ
ncbi:MAG: carbohydrate kinase [Firmicutes bacterium]|nr:carbohydrate kinase [Bacillota bacterium]